LLVDALVAATLEVAATFSGDLLSPPICLYKSEGHCHHFPDCYADASDKKKKGDSHSHNALRLSQCLGKVAVTF
jgi:hypothetical protein